MRIGFQFGQNLEPILLGEHDVQCDGVGLQQPGLSQSLFAVASVSHAVATCFQVVLEHFPGVGVVFHHQHQGTLVAFSRLRVRGLLFSRFDFLLGSWGLAERECKGESGTFAFPLAAHGNSPAVQLHELLGEGEPQAGTFLLSRVGRIHLLELAENAFLILGRNADARVADLHLQQLFAVFPAHFGCTDANFAAFRGKLDSVTQQVVEDLLKFSLIGIQGRQIVLHAVHEPDAFLGSQRFHDVEYIRDGFGHFETSQFQLHAARFHLGQVQDVVDQLQQVFATGEDVVDVFELLRIQLAEHLIGQHLGEPDNGIQGRAQLVAHAGQELALGLVGPFRRFLCFEQLDFRAFPFGDVPHRDDAGFAVFVRNAATGKLHGEVLPVLADSDGLEKSVAFWLVLPVTDRPNEVRDAASDGFFRFTTEDGGEGRIHVENFAIPVDDNALERGFRQTAKAFFTATQGFGGFSQFFLAVLIQQPEGLDVTDRAYTPDVGYRGECHRAELRKSPREQCRRRAMKYVVVYQSGCPNGEAQSGKGREPAGGQQEGACHQYGESKQSGVPGLCQNAYLVCRVHQYQGESEERKGMGPAWTE